MRILQSKQVGRLLARKAARLSEAEAVVRPILEAVRQRGDRALVEYARQFDGLPRRSVRVPASELARARRKLAPEFARAVDVAAANIRAYAIRQMPREWTRQMGPGLRLGQIVRPLDTVAAYIPSGRYPLPSTLLMTVVPAQVAGVRAICVASPRPVTEVFGAAGLLGELFRVHPEAGPDGPGGARTDAVAPIVGIGEAAARPADHRRAQRFQGIDQGLPDSSDIGDAAVLADPHAVVDYAAQVLDEVAVQQG